MVGHFRSHENTVAKLYQMTLPVEGTLHTLAFHTNTLLIKQKKH